LNPKACPTTAASPPTNLCHLGRLQYLFRLDRRSWNRISSHQLASRPASMGDFKLSASLQGHDDDASPHSYLQHRRAFHGLTTSPRSKLSPSRTRLSSSRPLAMQPFEPGSSSRQLPQASMRPSLRKARVSSTRLHMPDRPRNSPRV